MADPNVTLHIALSDILQALNIIRVIKSTAILQRMTYDHITELEASLEGAASGIHTARREVHDLKQSTAVQPTPDE
jgi:hypothetical protein